MNARAVTVQIIAMPSRKVTAAGRMYCARALRINVIDLANGRLELAKRLLKNEFTYGLIA